jgi:hypothetical protein
MNPSVSTDNVVVAPLDRMALQQPVKNEAVSNHWWEAGVRLNEAAAAAGVFVVLVSFEQVWPGLDRRRSRISWSIL